MKRSKSLDLKKLKDIDGKIIRRKSLYVEEKTVHFGLVFEGEHSKILNELQGKN